jgi:hypothetical protein
MRARKAIAPILAALLLSCQGSQPKHEHTTPLAATEHERQAEEHEALARANEERAAPSGEDPYQQVQCIDSGVPLTSGGETIKVMKPCWTGSQNSSEAFLRAAAYNRKAAADHRRWAKELVETEKKYCAPFGEDERSHGPFFHTQDIISVVQYEKGNTLKGARATFRKVPGLSLDWLRQNVKCHMARAATMGFDAKFMPYSPLTVAKAKAKVEETDAGFVITVTSDDPVSAATIYGRAEAAPHIDHDPDKGGH